MGCFSAFCRTTGRLRDTPFEQISMFFMGVGGWRWRYRSFKSITPLPPVMGILLPGHPLAGGRLSIATGRRRFKEHLSLSMPQADRHELIVFFIASCWRRPTLEHTPLLGNWRPG